MNTGDGLPDLPGIEKADALKRLLNKPALYEKILRESYARLKEFPTEMRAALSSGDFVSAERHAHSAKGLAGTIGALDLQNASLMLEKALRQGEAPSDNVFAEFEQALQKVIDGIAIGFGIDRAP